MNGRGRVEAAIAMGVADRPPVGAWGHTYREEWSPQALASITVERARQFGWDFVKFQPRASSFAEAFGSVYKPAGHRLKGPVLITPAVPDLESWRTVELVNRKALDDQVESIGMVVQRCPPMRVEPELRADARNAGAGRQLVDPQPGQPITGRRQEVERPGGDGRAGAASEPPLRSGNRGRGRGAAGGRRDGRPWI